MTAIKGRMKFYLLFLEFFPFLGFTQTWINRTASNLYDVLARSMVEMEKGNVLVAGTQAFSRGFLSVNEPIGICNVTDFLIQPALSS